MRPVLLFYTILWSVLLVSKCIRFDMYSLGHQLLMSTILTVHNDISRRKHPFSVFICQLSVAISCILFNLRDWEHVKPFTLFYSYLFSQKQVYTFGKFLVWSLLHLVADKDYIVCSRIYFYFSALEESIDSIVQS